MPYLSGAYSSLLYRFSFRTYLYDNYSVTATTCGLLVFAILSVATYCELVYGLDLSLNQLECIMHVEFASPIISHRAIPVGCLRLE